MWGRQLFRLGFGLGAHQPRPDELHPDAAPHVAPGGAELPALEPDVDAEDQQGRDHRGHGVDQEHHHQAADRPEQRQRPVDLEGGPERRAAQEALDPGHQVQRQVGGEEEHGQDRRDQVERARGPRRPAPRPGSPPCRPAARPARRCRRRGSAATRAARRPGPGPGAPAAPRGCSPPRSTGSPPRSPAGSPSPSARSGASPADRRPASPHPTRRDRRIGTPGRPGSRRRPPPRVPRGIERAGSRRSPDMLTPAMMPVTAGKKTAKTAQKLLPGATGAPRPGRSAPPAGAPDSERDQGEDDRPHDHVLGPDRDRRPTSWPGAPPRRSSPGRPRAGRSGGRSPPGSRRSRWCRGRPTAPGRSRAGCRPRRPPRCPASG